MRYRYIHIIAALFLIVGMGVQAIVSYHRAAQYVQEEIDLEMRLAQQKLFFELYDVYDVTMQIEDFIADVMNEPDELLNKTHEVVRHYPQFFSCYVAFPENSHPRYGQWYCPCSYRQHDTVNTINFGTATPLYINRAWYKGALVSDNVGFWSQPYKDDDFEETIFTFSDDMRNENGDLICVIGSDFSVSWLHQLLDQFKPFDEAVFAIYSSNGDLLAMSGQRVPDENDREWIVRRKTLEPINIDLVMAVPRQYIWESILWSIGLPFIVFLLGIIIVGVLIRRLWRDREESARLELVKRDLHIANQIQMSILHRDFPTDGELEMYADLLPMREVGGDLYDFHREGDTLWFIIGDVSGKGMPAAMFMASTVNLFRAAGRKLSSPKAIMEEMNDVLSDNNPSLTFVTAFIGCLHIPTGELLYCNAGHCAPLIVKSNSPSVLTLQMEPNIPLGYDGNYQFVEQGYMLDEGDQLVLYTDGVTEARNADRHMLGMKRWVEIVAQRGDLIKAVKDFIGLAEHSDDITLMTIRKSSPVQPVTVRVPNREDRWPILRRAIHEFGLCIGMNKKTLKKLEVAAEEAVVNILRYSGAAEIELMISRQQSTVSLQLTDDGVAFDPTAHKSNDKATEERQIGGMGIRLIREIADEVRYQRIDEKNRLTIIKIQ